jgi:hypothetical protein
MGLWGSVVSCPSPEPFSRPHSCSSISELPGPPTLSCFLPPGGCSLPPAACPGLSGLELLRGSPQPSAGKGPTHSTQPAPSSDNCPLTGLPAGHPAASLCREGAKASPPTMSSHHLEPFCGLLDLCSWLVASQQLWLSAPLVAHVRVGVGGL